MAPDANPDSEDADEVRFSDISDDLADAVEAVLPRWIERLVTERVRAVSGQVDAEVRERAVEAGFAARQEVAPVLRELLSTDVDAQRTNPLAILRGATRFAHAVLADVGVPPVERDEFSRRSFPDDHYDLMPARWDDIDPSLHDPGITWGAAKAYLHKSRRRAGDTAEEEGGS